MNYYQLRAEDVGKPWLHAFGHVWPVSGFMGRILPQDVGKRVYQRGNTKYDRGILQVENDEQRDARTAGRTARRNPMDEFADYDPSDRETLGEVRAAFKEFEESLLSTHPADLKEGFTVAHGYVPAWRDLLGADLDRRTSGLSRNALESGILDEMFEETCNRLGAEGIIIWGDEGDGTVLWAGTERAYEKYSGEG